MPRKKDKIKSDPYATNPPIDSPKILTPARAALLGLVAVMLFTAGLRIHLLDFPLERDEGEYAYAGQLLLDGQLPFDAAYNMKMPGIYVCYAIALLVFGQTLEGIHLALLVLNLATAWLLFGVFKRLGGLYLAAIGASFFLIISLGPNVHGFMANSEHFVLFFVSGGLLLLLDGLKKQGPLLLGLAGLALGLGFMMKQHAVFFILFGGVYLLARLMADRRAFTRYGLISLSFFSVGVFLPFIIACLVFWSAGVFDRFWFWTFTYAREYVSQGDIKGGLAVGYINLVNIIKDIWPIAALSLVGLASVFWARGPARRAAAFTYPLAFFSVLALFPGFYFRPHYFILALPICAFFAAKGLISIGKIIPRPWPNVLRIGLVIALFLAVASFQFIHNKTLYFVMDPTRVSRWVYGPSPFPESIEIAEYIKQNSLASDRIAILGSEPQVYFYARRRAVSPYLYVYPLMEHHPFARSMQEELAQAIETTQPRYVIYFNIRGSWAMVPSSDSWIFKWMQEFIPKNYVDVGYYFIVSPAQTIARWGVNASPGVIGKRNEIFIFEHKRHHRRD